MPVHMTDNEWRKISGEDPPESPADEEKRARAEWYRARAERERERNCPRGESRPPGKRDKEIDAVFIAGAVLAAAVAVFEAIAAIIIIL